MVNWNTRDKLRACLSSLIAQTAKARIVVVDNASTDGSAEMVRAEFPNVELVALAENTGYARGNNIGFARLTEPNILTLNPDTELQPDNLERGVEILSQHPDCAALSVKFIGPAGEVQRSVRGFPTLAGIFGQLSGLDRIFPTSAFGHYSQRHFDYTQPGYADQPMGTYLLFRRDVLAKIGDPDSPFDERFPIFFNEVDLLKRLRDAGYRCWYEPSIQILHHHGSSTRQIRAPMIWESHLSLIRYLEKHLRGWRRMLLPLVSLASRTAAFLRTRTFHGGFRAQHNHM